MQRLQQCFSCFEAAYLKHHAIIKFNEDGTKSKKKQNKRRLKLYLGQKTLKYKTLNKEEYNFVFYIKNVVHRFQYIIRIILQKKQK